MNISIKTAEENTRTRSFISKDYSQPIQAHLDCFDSNRPSYKRRSSFSAQEIQERKQIVELKALSAYKRKAYRKRALAMLKLTDGGTK